ncbi:SDR family NAD(P)-dependent oxidoreductase [Gorillibacterium sp. sgz500922]|uniref:SDR family NAD(P)-dependent oxidoreductase n=1 Tax=Gorillibacterium sp. sgz500922 TaxID=3446694 RepID=UPI003F67220E
MELGLANKTALVTGSTKGIGRAIAMELAREGVHVLINGRSEEEAERMVDQLKADFPATSPQNAAADLTDPSGREALAERYPDIDILINNAGQYEIRGYDEINEEVWDTYIRTNVLAADGLCRLYLPRMRKKGFGRILFLASEEAIMPSGQMPHYAVTKSMLLSLARSLSKLTAGTEITVNTLLPGPTLSEKVQQIIEGFYPDEEISFSEKERRFMAESLPHSELQRFIRPSEIGRLAAFVCSPYASAFRGSPLRMDGGLVPTIF